MPARPSHSFTLSDVYREVDALLPCKHSPWDQAVLDRIDAVYEEIEDLCRTGKPKDALAALLSCFHLASENPADPFGPTGRRVFELLMTKCVEIERFAGNDHMAQINRGSVAQHVMQVAALVGKVFYLSFPETFLLGSDDEKSPLAQAFREAAMHKQIRDMMTDCVVQALIHDLGEIFIELSTVATRAKSEVALELPDYERKFTEFALRAALKNIEKLGDPVAQEAAFADTIDTVKAVIGKATGDDGVTAGQGVAETLDAALSPLVARDGLARLNLPSLSLLRYFMAAYDEVEGSSLFGQFTGIMVKAIENNQSESFFIKHAGHDGGASFEHAPSKMVMGAAMYSEGRLGKLFGFMDTQDPIVGRLAQQTAILAYATALCHFRHMDAPVVIDRAAPLRRRVNGQTTADEAMRAESSALEPDARDREIRAAAARILKQNMSGKSPTELETMVDAARPIDDFSKPEITRHQLESLYRSALAEALETPAFRPPAKPLAGLSELPPAIAARMKNDAAAKNA